MSLPELLGPTVFAHDGDLAVYFWKKLKDCLPVMRTFSYLFGGLAVVDDFRGISNWIKEIAAIIARMIMVSRTRLAIVFATGLKTFGMELIDGFLICIMNATRQSQVIPKSRRIHASCFLVLHQYVSILFFYFAAMKTKKYGPFAAKA